MENIYVAKKKSVRRAVRAPKSEDGVNKTQEIKDYMREHPGAGPKEVASELNKKGIEVSAQYVSTIKSLHKRRATTLPALESEDISLASILAAKRLVEEVGSVAKARAALEALSMLS